MNTAQLLAFEVIQFMIEKIQEHEDERDEEFERVLSEELLSLFAKKAEEEDEEEAPSTSEKVNKVKLPKNWGKVDGVRF
jgi:hypothetical protein